MGDVNSNNNAGGRCVSLSSDGNILAVAGKVYIGNDSVGGVKIYKKKDGKWEQEKNIIGSFSPGGRGFVEGFEKTAQTLIPGFILHPDINHFQGNWTWPEMTWHVNWMMLSSDGSTLAVSGSTDVTQEPNNEYGSVRIFKNESDNWKLKKYLPVEAPNDVPDNQLQGVMRWTMGSPTLTQPYGDHTISLNSDGSILAVGFHFSPNSKGDWNNYTENDFNATDTKFWPGVVRIYKNTAKDGVKWTQMGDTIIGESNNDQFGGSISLSSDGSIVAIGAPNKNSQKGQVRIYKYNDNEKKWNQIGNNIDGINENDACGVSISISSDGSILAISSPVTCKQCDPPLVPKVRIYKYNDNEKEWNQIGNDIDGKNTRSFGLSISLSSDDGSIVAIGDKDYSPEDAYTTPGRVIIYKYNDNENKWNKVGSDIEDERDKKFWYNSKDNVSIEDKAHLDENGAVIELTPEDSQRGFINPVRKNLAGFSVSLSSDGSVVAMGAPNLYSQYGSVNPASIFGQAVEYDGFARVYQNEQLISKNKNIVHSTKKSNARAGLLFNN